MPVARPCLTCGELTTRPRRAGRGYRCEACDTGRERAAQRRQDANRPNAAARGYNADHQRLRAALAPLVDAGEATCWRCGRLIEPGTTWHLGHLDDRSGYGGPEHARCNIDASNGRFLRPT